MDKDKQIKVLDTMVTHYIEKGYKLVDDVLFMDTSPTDGLGPMTPSRVLVKEEEHTSVLDVRVLFYSLTLESFCVESMSLNCEYVIKWNTAKVDVEQLLTSDK